MGNCKTGGASQDPLNEATDETNAAANLAASGMQAAKDKVSGVAQSVVVKAAAAWGSGGGADDEGAGAQANETQQRGGEDVGRAAEEWSEPHPHGHGEQGGHEQHPHGALERMKEAAAHAVEGVKMRLHLGTGGGGAEPTAEERTGEAMHMAKAAEGRNKAEDNPIDHAIHDALRLERGERPEVSAFPETLSDAVAVAQIKDLPADPPSAAAAATASSEEPAPGPNPFTASSAARSRL